MSSPGNHSPLVGGRSGKPLRQAAKARTPSADRARARRTDPLDVGAMPLAGTMKDDYPRPALPPPPPPARPRGSSPSRNAEMPVASSSPHGGAIAAAAGPAPERDGKTEVPPLLRASLPSSGNGAQPPPQRSPPRTPLPPPPSSQRQNQQQPPLLPSRTQPQSPPRTPLPPPPSSQRQNQQQPPLSPSRTRPESPPRTPLPPPPSSQRQNQQQPPLSPSRTRPESPPRTLLPPPPSSQQRQPSATVETAAPQQGGPTELQSAALNVSSSAPRSSKTKRNSSIPSLPIARPSEPLHAHNSAAPTPTHERSGGLMSRKTSAGIRSDGNAGNSVHATVREDGVEELMEIPLRKIQPIEKFFIEYNSAAAERGDDVDNGQPRNDNEVLLEQFAEYTDDDSFFSSGDTVIQCDPQRLRNDRLRQRSIVSVHNTLQLRALTNGRVPEDAVWSSITRTSWLYQIHQRALALQHSSLFIFPAQWMPRVVVYNVLHHWAMELLLLLIILGYAIFQATWARYTAPPGSQQKPDHIIWADVYYTCLLGFEVLARIFASGLVLHQRAFLRSMWHWLDVAVLILSIMECTWWQELWNFTAWRLLRILKCLTYVPAPVRMKLLAKTLLRSTNRLLQVSLFLVYFIFFFGLLGLQLFVGTLHNRCVSTLTGAATSQVCRSVSTGQYWFYWGRSCGAFSTCVSDAFPNPHFDFRSFDDIGHAMLSVFQIMTFQGWSGLLQETNDGVAVMAFLYYAFTILLCTWVVPSLYLGVFVEKLDKTSRLFVLKQLDFFDRMLTEQRQRMSAMVRLRDYVERDENGLVSHYPAYTRQQERDTKRLTDDDDDTTTTDGKEDAKKPRGAPKRRSHHRPIQSTKWTDEQRIQLQLALTRQRSVAEEAERKRRLQRVSLGELIVKDGRLSRQASLVGAAPHPITASAAASPDAAGAAKTVSPIQKGRDEFALGGRVGSVQHHPADFAIGDCHQSDLPFAARQEAQAEQLRFLDAYTNGASTAKNDLYNSAMASGTSAAERTPTGTGAEKSVGLNSRPNSGARPPLGGSTGPSRSVLRAREAAGVVPNRRSMSVRGSSLSRTSSGGSLRSVSRLHASMTQLPEEAPQRQLPQLQQQPEQMEYVINDPEGGDFTYAKTFTQKLSIVRNIAHMFTEGYPRILTQYLWEHRWMQYRYGLAPLSYTNKYEDEALRRLRQRRSQERRGEREERRRRGLGHHLDVDDNEDAEEEEEEDASVETPWMRKEGLVAGSLSPIRMACNIRENAPITVFNGLMYFLIVANAAFNAARYDTMSDAWETGTFVAGVCFSALFTLELLIRLLALGPGPFFADVLILIEATFTVLSLFQLGFSRSNTLSLFNWVRFLRLFRIVPCRPLRRVTRVLLYSFPDMLYALILFSVYMFMWLLLGMSFFGSRIGLLNNTTSDYTTRGNFETFSHAVYAVAQAFSVNRDEWLYLSWSGMRARGSYTVLYFIATVGVAFIFQYFLIAVMTYAWQAQQEQEDYAFMSGSSHGQRGSRSRLARLPFFDFSVWRSFKHIHGGFERRDVAPDEVYFLNDDMARQLRLVEVKDRYYRSNYGQANQDWSQLAGEEDPYSITLGSGAGGARPTGPQYLLIGGHLYRQPELPATKMGSLRGDVLRHRGQQRFARNIQAIAATTYANATPPLLTALPKTSLSGEMQGSLRPTTNLPLSHTPSVAPTRRGMSAGAPSVADALAEARMNPSNISLAPRLPKLGNAAAIGSGQEGAAMTTTEWNGPDGVTAAAVEEHFEHLLLPGPRLRYKSTMEGGRRVFETCLDCNTHIQMTLKAPIGVVQRSAEELHAEHCHMAAVRSTQQLVLNALIGYTRMQADHDVRPTKRMVEVVLGQAWSCGMLLFDTIENLSCADVPEEERTWDRMLEALELQQWLLGLHVGEEQVGRATLAYILAHQTKQDAVVRERSYAETWKDRSFFVLAPSNPVRRTVSGIVNSTWFEVLILCVIYAASICLAVYTPGSDDKDLGGSFNSGKYDALHVLDDIFILIFVGEMLLKWVSMGVVLPAHRAYFWHRWNIFDSFIVITSLISWGSSTVFLRYLKALRCFRIIGPLRSGGWGGRGSNSMSLVARTIWDSIPTLANVCLLMLMNYIVWAILFVSMFMNKLNFCSNSGITNRTQCLAGGFTWAPQQRNFRNFYESLLTTVEISTGAEWLDIIYSAVDSRSTVLSPLTNRHPYLGLVFIAYYYVSHFILFTLFISAVIYCYMLATSATEDAIGSTLEHQIWLRVQGMILRIKPKPRLLPLNNPVSRRVHRLLTQGSFEALMGLILVFNMLTMSLEWYHMSDTQRVTLDIFQYIWVGLFTAEVILRCTAHGLRFFTRWAYCWDLLVVLLSYLQIGLNTTATHAIPFNVNVLRLLRLGRVLHLVHFTLPLSTHLSLFQEVLKASVPGLISVTFLYMIAVYVFAILGLHLLGYIVPFGGYIDGTYNNFGTFVNALIMVFRLSTLENWVAMLRGSLDRGNYCNRANHRCGPTNWAPVYYVPLVICFLLLLSTLYMAVVLEKYVAAVRMRAVVTRLDELRRFCQLWAQHDPNSTLWLPSMMLPKLLEELRLPLGVTDRHRRIEVMQLLREYNIPDHNGRVYYYEVLMPLARRVMAMAFYEAGDVYGAGGDQAPMDVAWHLSERSLGALPASYAAIKPSNVTVAEQYAAALVQAAYRRDRAMRNLYIARSELWRAGRAACEARGLPYESYGFGKTRLAGPDPREEGVLRGFNIPKGATLANAVGGRVYADPVADRIAAMRDATRSEGRPAADDSAAVLLPAVYRSAISAEEKRFGPDAPNAIHRHERREEKLERNRAQEAHERQRRERSNGASPARASGERDEGSVPTTVEGADEFGSGPEGVFRDHSLEPPSVARGNHYTLDPLDANYQPPLGANPEELRQEELSRRLGAVQKIATTSPAPDSTPREIVEGGAA